MMEKNLKLWTRHTRQQQQHLHFLVVNLSGGWRSWTHILKSVLRVRRFSFDKSWWNPPVVLVLWVHRPLTDWFAFTEPQRAAHTPTHTLSMWLSSAATQHSSVKPGVASNFIFRCVSYVSISISYLQPPLRNSECFRIKVHSSVLLVFRV